MPSPAGRLGCNQLFGRPGSDWARSSSAAPDGRSPASGSRRLTVSGLIFLGCRMGEYKEGNNLIPKRNHERRLLSSAVMWILLTFLAVALSQQPRIRRVMHKEITDYKANAEMKAYEREAAAAAQKHTQTSAAAAGPN